MVALATAMCTSPQETSARIMGCEVLQPVPRSPPIAMNLRTGVAMLQLPP